MNSKYIVIGGVAAGMSAAARIRKIDPASDVIVLEKGEFISYSACSMPYYISNDKMSYKDLIILTPEKAMTERGITVKTECEVVKLRTTRKELTYINKNSGKERILNYDRLVIATGASAIVPPVKGIERDNVFLLRKLKDGIRLKKYLHEKRCSKVGVIGGGLVGLEMCESFSKLGKEVSLVEMEDTPLKNFSVEITKVVKQKLIDNRINLCVNSKATEINDSGIVLNNETIVSDLILLSVGVKPNAKLAFDAGIGLGVNNSIAVDSKMETSVSGIFAAGDCAESLNRIVNKKTYMPLGTVANKQGRVAGVNAAKGFEKFKGVLGSVEFKLFDLEVAKTGLTTEDAYNYGFDPVEVSVTVPSAAHGYSERFPIEIAMVGDRRTGRLLGVQMAGKTGVAHRVNIVAASICLDVSVEEFSHMDFAYAPPFAPVWDPLLVAANVLKNKI